MTRKTVLTALQIAREVAIGAVLTLLAVHAVVAGGQTGALVAQFTLVDAQAVAAVFRTVDASTVITIFIHFCLRNEITVLRIVGTVRVVRVDVQMWIHKETEVWNF